MHNLLFCTHTLCRNYVTNTFLLVSSSVRSKQLLCFVHRLGQKSEQKHTRKDFVEFHNHSPLLTMVVGILQSTQSMMQMGPPKFQSTRVSVGVAFAFNNKLSHPLISMVRYLHNSVFRYSRSVKQCHRRRSNTMICIQYVWLNFAAKDISFSMFPKLFTLSGALSNQISSFKQNFLLGL